MTTPTILALICLLVPPAAQEHNGERIDRARERYEVIADGIFEVAGEDERLVLFLLTIAKHESSFRRSIHAGEVKGDAGRSWGLFQLNLGPKPETEIKDTPYRAEDIVGVDEKATRRAVEVTAGLIAPRIESCQGAPYCVFKAYAGVAGDPPYEMEVRLRSRVNTYRKLAGERAAQKKRAALPQGLPMPLATLAEYPAFFLQGAEGAL